MNLGLKHLGEIILIKCKLKDFMNDIKINKMKTYLEKNLEPILVGFTLAMMTIYLVNNIFNIILKITVIINK